jgi:hypothetical protein
MFVDCCALPATENHLRNVRRVTQSKGGMGRPEGGTVTMRRFWYVFSIVILQLTFWFWIFPSLKGTTDDEIFAAILIHAAVLCFITPFLIWKDFEPGVPDSEAFDFTVGHPWADGD